MIEKNLILFGLVLFTTPGLCGQEEQSSDYFLALAPQVIEELRVRTERFPGTVISLDLGSQIGIDASGPERTRQIERVASDLGISAVYFSDLRICPPDHEVIRECRLPHPYSRVVHFENFEIGSEGRHATVTIKVWGQNGGSSIWTQIIRAEFRREENAAPWSLEELAVTLET